MLEGLVNKVESKEVDADGELGAGEDLSLLPQLSGSCKQFNKACSGNLLLTLLAL